MTQNKQATLLDSIQSEVSREASPILEFLVNNSRKIFMGLTLFVLLVLGFGIFTYYTVSQQRSAQEALGKILIMPESAAKITQLEAFAASGKPELKTAALMALANSASLQNLPDKAAQAWGEVAKSADAATRLTAGLAQAGALQKQGKNAEALSLLEGLLQNAPEDAKPTINSLIVSVAESLGNWDRAMTACGAVITKLNPGSEARGIWEQRLAYFAAKK